MKVKIEIEFDTDNSEDMKKIEETLYNLEQVREILHKLDHNLNNNVQKRKREQR